jgi:dolichol kinase
MLMNFKAELYRKSIHLLSLAIPISYLILTREELLIWLSIATFMVATIDIIRFFSSTANQIFMRFFAVILRAHERKSISGATYLMMSALTVVILFDKTIVIPSILFVVLCDSTAAIVGKKFGKIHIFQKTLEGSLAFFAMGCIIVYLVEPRSPLPGFAGAFTAALVELLPLNIDDNFSIPIVSALTIFACLKLL